MSMMGTTVGVLFYIMLTFVFIISFTSICYELSPYSRRDATTRLPSWERKTLYTIAGYPPLSLLLFAILIVLLPEWYNTTAPTKSIVVWYCIGHILISVLGATGAWYLRRRNKRNTIYFVTDVFSGSIYVGCLIVLFFGIYH